MNIRYILAKWLLKNNEKYDIIRREDVFLITCKQKNKKTSYTETKLTEGIQEKGVAELMCKASEIGKIVVNKCIEQGFEINTQKLQKLLVLIQIECIEQSGFPFFTEDVRIWECGVAIKEVDEDFRANGAGFFEPQQIQVVLLKSEEQYIDEILQKHGQKTAAEINKLPQIQKVLELGEIREGDTVSHVSAEKLTEKFAHRYGT